MRSRLTRLAFAMTLTAALIGAAATPATAAPRGKPSPRAASEWADCPKLAPGQNPEDWFCSVAEGTGGEFQLGTVFQKIDKPIRVTFAIGVGGYLMGKVRAEPLEVPGGLLGIPGSENFPGMMVHAIAEDTGLIGPGSEGGNIALGLKLRLSHPLLGCNCYIGSDADPIKFDLTYNTTNPPPPNKPISGSPPEIEGDNLKVTYVDNAFRVPAAKHCGLLGLGLLDPILNHRVQLPSPAGKNTAILKQLLKLKSYSELPPA